MRVFNVVITAFCTVAAACAVAPALAQEDCMPALVQDVVSIDKGSIVSLALLDKKLQKAENDKKTGTFATYGDTQLGFDQSGRMVSSFETLLDIDYTEAERELIRTSTLSGNAVRAYLECLASRQDVEIPAAISSGAFDSDSFFLTLYWKDSDRPDEETATAKLLITQGKFSESDRPILEVPVTDREGVNVVVTRNRFQPSEISIEIAGSDPVVIKVPEVPSRRLVRVSKPGDSFSYYAIQSTGTFGQDLCVTLDGGDSDSVFVPNSFKLVYAKKAAAKVAFQEGEIVESPGKICQNFQGAWQSPFSSFADVNVQAVADVLKSEPVPEAFSNGEMPVPATVAAPG